MHVHVNISNVNSITLGGRYFFDANVWMTINGPYVDTHKAKTKIYSRIRRRIPQSGGTLFSDCNVISEFINRYARLVHEEMKRSGDAPADFKQFRKSESFSDLAEEIAEKVRIMTSPCTVVPVEATKARINEICDGMCDGGSDFNDQLIADTCRRNELTLVTHDSDFLSISIPIISANAAYNQQATSLVLTAS